MPDKDDARNEDLGEIQRLRAELAAMRKDRDHWKANHDHRVEAVRALSERPDLPFERVSAYRAYVALQEQCAALAEDRDEWKASAQSFAEFFRRNLLGEPVSLYPCGFKKLFQLVVVAGAELAQGLQEGEPVSEAQRETAMRLVGYARDMASLLAKEPLYPCREKVRAAAAGSVSQ